MDDLTQANKAAFDQFSATYDASPWQLRIAKLLVDSLQQRKSWLAARWTSDGSQEVKLLDYACGTGAASIALRPFVTVIRGVDLSEGMTQKYNETMRRLSISQTEAHAVVGDITNAEHCSLPELQDQYDVAIISLALHHVSNAEILLRELAKRLKPAGVLIVVDFLPFKHSHHKSHRHHSMAHTIKQHGFTEEQMQDLYTAAGLKSFGFVSIPDKIHLGEGEHNDEDCRYMFIARGNT